MNEFMENARKTTNVAYTENGALSKESSLSNVLDFFSKSGALRGNADDYWSYFLGAFSENKELALKALFYSRDIRGGQGERLNFRYALHRLFVMSTDNNLLNLIPLIPEYGRWDDLFALFETPAEDAMVLFVLNKIREDWKSDTPSLLAKWMPSENASAKETKLLAKKFITAFGITPKKYRQTLSAMRKKIDIVERKMSSKNWEDIKYSAVPSNAMMRYRTAFYRNDENRFSDYIAKVESGEEKIHSGTLYPYDIVNKQWEFDTPDKVLEEQWKALPDYMNGENAIAVVDTSGSMLSGRGNVTPINVSISLGIYFAERSKGVFKDYFITFSERPKVQKIVGDTLFEKCKNLRHADWGYNTNLQAVFDMLLETAKKMNATKDDMPTKVYIISDMGFDQACEGRTNYEEIRRKYEAAGYERPELVFWNVNAYSDVPVEKDEYGTYLVSGCSPSILKYAMNVEEVTPEQLMLDVLNSERYSKIDLT